MTSPSDTLLITPALSARAITSVYSVTLLSTLPLVGAMGAAWLFRRASAEARALVWRSAIAFADVDRLYDRRVERLEDIDLSRRNDLAGYACHNAVDLG